MNVQTLFSTFRQQMDELPAALLTVATVLRGSAAEPPPPTGEYLTVREAAAEFSISERALYRMTHVHRRVGRSIRIRRSDLRRALNESGPLLT